MDICIGFTLQGFGIGGTTGVASVRGDQELPPCLEELQPMGRTYTGAVWEGL